MDMLRIVGKVLFMIFNGSDDMGTEALAVWLRRHKISVSHEVIWVHNRHWRCYISPHDSKSQNEHGHGET